MVEGHRVVGPSGPAERRRRLDRQDRRHRAQHLVLIVVVLLVEKLPARHGHHPGGDAVGRQQLGRAHADRHLGAGADAAPCRDRRPRRPGRRRPRSSSTALVSVPARTGTFWRVSTRAVGPSRSMATRKACADSLASAGRITRSPGMARMAASCSTGWWVGPSCAEPHRVVAPEVDHLRLRQGGQANRSSHVVAEDEERSADRDGAAVAG